jgi:hypothetical protein
MAGMVRTDRFGNPYTVVGFKNNKNGFPVAYAELGNQLYKLEVTHAKKEGIELWCRITKVKKNYNSNKSL